jgi:D-aspartate ligase
VGFTGFSNFDIKYDQRDGKFKAFEINTRQGRSNYYVTGAGYNLAKILVEDRVEHKPLELVVTRNRSLWRVVPQRVAYAYTPKKYHAEMKALIRAGAAKNPLFYGPDKHPTRRLRMTKNALGHFVKFKQYYKKPD